MTIVVQSAPTTEPLTVAEVLLHCRIDQSNQELAPGAITAALVSPAAVGNVNTGVHRYRVTFVTADGETEGGVVSDAVTVANSAVNGRVLLSAIAVGGSAVTSRKIYRTAAGGSIYLLLTTIADNTTTTYTDNIADASLGAGAPTTNTTTDPLISALIKASRLSCEQELGRYLITQTLDAYYDRFPTSLDYSRPPSWSDLYTINLPPLQSVTSITYTDNDGNVQTLAANQYTVDTATIPARVGPAYGVSWPSTRDIHNAVKVRFVGGYGNAASVPQCVKLWMLQRIKHSYDNPGVMTGGTFYATPFARAYVDGLIDSEKVTARI